ncbi:hypothetical protein Pelo_16663 [Pelomyxa schiedti]|nr:hypothetical protein Pelo_16663 [Pelomyxa schiedti]
MQSPIMSAPESPLLDTDLSPRSPTPSPSPPPPLSPSSSPQSPDFLRSTSPSPVPPSEKKRRSDTRACQMWLRRRTSRQLQITRDTEQTNPYNTRKRRNRKPAYCSDSCSDDEEPALISAPKSRGPLKKDGSVLRAGIIIPSSNSISPIGTPTSASVTPTPSPTSLIPGVERRNTKQKPRRKKATSESLSEQPSLSCRESKTRNSAFVPSSASAHRDSHHKHQTTHVNICMGIWNAQYYPAQQHLLQSLFPLPQPYLSYYAADPTLICRMVKYQRKMVAGAQQPCCCSCQGPVPQASDAQSSLQKETKKFSPQCHKAESAPFLHHPTPNKTPQYNSTQPQILMDPQLSSCSFSSGNSYCSQPHSTIPLSDTNLPPEWATLPLLQLPPDDSEEEDTTPPVKIPLKQTPLENAPAATFAIGSED